MVGEQRYAGTKPQTGGQYGAVGGKMICSVPPAGERKQEGKLTMIAEVVDVLDGAGTHSY